MNEISLFFESLGEIWRDVTALEFLMRSAIARSDGEIHLFPKSPYVLGKIYAEYPDSFSHFSFEMVANKFNKRFPGAIPWDEMKELVRLRDAMAHGVIAQIDNSDVHQLVKLKEQKNIGLVVEFSVTLEQEKLNKIRQSLFSLRRTVMALAAD